MELEIRDLNLVRAIVDHGGLSRAADFMHLTPSALSHRLADLERRAGSPLFNRVGRQLQLTPAGEAMVAAAPGVLTAMGEVEAAVRRTASERKSVVRIATECYTCYHWLGPVVSSFERDCPGVEVRVMVAATRRAVRALLDGELDVAIADRRPRERAVVFHPLFRSDIVAVVAPSHPWASRAFVRPADFATERVLRYPMPREESTLLHDILAPAGVVPADEETVELTEALLELVRAGRGVAALASWVVAPRVERGELAAIPIRSPNARRRWSAVTRRRARVDPHIAAFVEALRQIPMPSTQPVESGR